MLSVAIKSDMLSVLILNAIILNVVAPTYGSVNVSHFNPSLFADLA
jgi:hypothetical protein